VGNLDSARLCARAAELREDFVRLEPSVSTEGEYDVWVFGAACGWLNLEVTIDGRHTVNSPALLEVAAGGAVAWRCFATGSGIEPKASVFCNETARFILVACDANALPRSRGGDAFRVAIVPRHAGTDSMVVHDSADGTYAVSWRPIVSGDYTVAVTLGGIHIRNSPYHVHVGPRRGPPPVAIHMGPNPGATTVGPRRGPPPVAIHMRPNPSATPDRWVKPEGPPPVAIHMRPSPSATPDRWCGQTHQRGLRAAYERAAVAAACGGASEVVEHAKLLATVERCGRSPQLRRAVAQRAYPDVATGIAAGIAARSFNFNAGGRGGLGLGPIRAAGVAAPPPVRAAWQEAAEGADSRGVGFDGLLAHLRRVVDDAGEVDGEQPLGHPPQGGRRGGEQAATGARPATLIEA